MAKETYVKLQKPNRSHSKISIVLRTIRAIIEGPFYWLLSHLLRTPGLDIHFKIVRMGFFCALRLFKNSPQLLYGAILFPIFTTRYFEFDFAWAGLSNERGLKQHLDVSSPRMLPLLALHHHGEQTNIHILNPDTEDLNTTIKFAKAIHNTNKFISHNCLIEELDSSVGMFDLITCISVLEHIRNDTHALKRMWELLKPGGKLILTLPCCVSETHEFINSRHYGLLSPDENGYVFFQYLYDEAALKQRIFSAVGQPTRILIYGEKKAGYLRDALLKNGTGSNYPFWKESWLMGKNCKYYESIAELPGEGVIGLEFVK